MRGAAGRRRARARAGAAAGAAAAPCALLLRLALLLLACSLSRGRGPGPGDPPPSVFFDSLPGFEGSRVARDQEAGIGEACARVSAQAVQPLYRNLSRVLLFDMQSHPLLGLGNVY